MAKKFGKFLVGTALVGAAVAGTVAYLTKYKKDEENWDDDFEDFEDDFEDDFKEDSDDEEVQSTSSTSREYVTIPTPSAEGISAEESSAEESSVVEAADSVAAKVREGAQAVADHIENATKEEA